MFVIAKMQVRSVEDYGMSRKVSFGAIHDQALNIGSTPENRAFTKATPSGEAWMTIDNQHVWSAFYPPRPVGEGVNWQTAQHYVVFINADEYNLADVYEALAHIKSSKTDA